MRRRCVVMKLIKNGTLVSPQESFRADILINGETIQKDRA